MGKVLLLAFASALLVAVPASADTIPPLSNSSWAASGAAEIYDPPKAISYLTPNEGGMAGSVLYRAAVSPSHLTVSFDERMVCGEESCNGADGMAFDILNASGLSAPPAVGDGGGELGFYPNTGLAVTLTQNSVPWGCYPSDHFVGIADSEQPSGCPLHYLQTATGVPTFHNAENHVVIELDWPTETITVSINGVQYLSYKLPSGDELPPSAYIGFSAGTGNGAEYHLVENVNGTYSPIEGSPAPTPPSPPGPVPPSPPTHVSNKCDDPPQASPRVAVILMEGVDSTSPNDTYNPRKVPTYCYTNKGGAKTKFPPSLQPLMDNFNPGYRPNSSGGSPSMTDAIASHRNVIFLPWSFNGVWIDKQTGFVHVNKSSAKTADQNPIENDALGLAEEVLSVHEAWPKTRIVILAHSLGGLIAEQYWERYWRSHHNGVARIISLDGVINGTKAVGGACSLVIKAAACPDFSYDVAHFLASLWTSLQWHDPAISEHDRDGAFLPVGTEGDLAYAIPNLGTDSLISQLLFKCGGWPIETCTPLPPAFVSPCPSQDHQRVKACPGVISYVDSAIFGSTATTSDVRFSTRPRRSSDLATTSISHSRYPARRLVAERPWAELEAPAAEPGDPVTLNGVHLGEVSGVLEFSAKTEAGVTDAAILSWGETSITVRVPPDAVSGPIILVAASGEVVPIEPVVILGASNGVSRLVTPARLRVSGTTARLRVIAFTGHVVAKKRAVSLFDGYGEYRSVTNSHGRVVFALKGVGRRNYVLHSGQVWRDVEVRWRPPPNYKLHLRTMPSRPHAGSWFWAAITVFGRAGRRAINVPVSVSVRDRRGRMLANRRRRTDRNGRIVLHLRNPRGDGVTVTVTAGASSRIFCHSSLSSRCPS
jgi:pimeloyl-ACP methyl ester carboxylesterase